MPVYSPPLENIRFVLHDVLRQCVEHHAYYYTRASAGKIFT